MRACVIQPPYSRDLSRSDELWQWKLDALSRCDRELDLIVLPEYSDVPCATATLEETIYYHDKYIHALMDSCRETAKRCSAILCVNALSPEEGGYRNTTYVFGRNGELLGKYFKKHLPPIELEVLKLDSDYTFCPSEPYILEIEGLRFAFLTCYDFYFYEAFARIAREEPDIVIGCSLQRSDSHTAIEIMCRNLAYNTNAYVVRSSVSFAEDSDICGASMIVNPKGQVLANMGGKFGMATADFDPRDKYYKPAGFGNPPAPHHKYIEYGRKPWQYRIGGAAITSFEDIKPYPRVCAHRGYNKIAPENSLPAYAAAIAMGADEIELDLWPTADGEIVCCHDASLERVSTGEGLVYEKTLSQLREYDFGIKFGKEYEGLAIPRLEDILAKFSGQAIMNIHIKPLPRYAEYPSEIMERIISLIRKYDARRHCYLMIERDADIPRFKALAPEIPVCVGHDSERPYEIVERAIALGADKVQLYKPYFNQAMVDLAREKGIICNLFFADEPDEAIRYLEMGVDTILTNNFNAVSRAVTEWKNTKKEKNREKHKLQGIS